MMTYPDGLHHFIAIASRPVKWLSSVEVTVKANTAQYAVNEIRRLRAKNNRLIRVHNEQDANGNHIGEHYAATEDLVLEEEI